MRIHIYQPGGAAAGKVEYSTQAEHATIRIGGGPPCDVVVPGLSPAPCAEIRIAGGRADVAPTGDVPVKVGGRAVAKGSAVPLGPEVLLTVGNAELVCRVQTGASAPPGLPPAPGAPAPAAAAAASANASEQPSVVAKDLLKDVYAALGVPEEHPALVAYDEQQKVVKRIDLVPPNEEVKIGRAPENRLVLHHNSVSKEHAAVLRDGLGFLVKDLGSRNGTKLNGEVIKGQARLRSGDRIGIGDLMVRFVDPKAAVQDLAASVPDLQKIERVRPGEKLAIGGGGDLEATNAIEQSLRKQAEEREAQVVRPETGVGIMAYVLIGAGILLLAAIVGVIVLAMA